MKELMRSHLHLTWGVVLFVNVVIVGALSGTVFPPTIVAGWLFSKFGFVGFLLGWFLWVGILLSPIGYTSDWVLKRKNRSTNWTFLWFLGAPLWLKNKSIRRKD